MRVRSSLASALAIMVLAVVGCRSSGDDTGPDSTGPVANGPSPVVLGVVPRAVGFDFWAQVRLGAECAASKNEGVAVLWNGATTETDVVGQINLLQRMLNQDVNGLVYAASDSTALVPVTDQALNQGTAVVNIDSGTTPQPPEVPLFASDNVAAAKKAADTFVASLGPGEKKVALLPHQPGSATSDQRTDGFKAGLKKHPNVSLVAEQATRSDFSTALSITERIIATVPDLDAVFALNEPSTLGAAEAIEKAGKAKQVALFGWDASPAEVDLLRSGVIDALVAQNPFQMGYEGVSAAVKMVREGVIVPSVDTGVSILTTENLGSREIQSLLNPSCAPAVVRPPSQ